MSEVCDEVFRITAFRNGMIDVAVCWDQIDVPGVARALHEIAAGLEQVPPDTRAVGVVPLRG